MTRKFSVTDSQNSAQLRGTFLRRKLSAASANSAQVLGFVVSDVSVHEAPQLLDRIEMRTLARNEMQLDPALRLGDPVLH
jgi:hypothetical protein